MRPGRIVVKMASFSGIRGILCGGACLLTTQTALAHVAFVAEEQLILTPGETVTLQWYDVVPHDTIAYHLEFLLEPDAEPESIVRDLAPDVYSYDWVVPDVMCDSCELHVTQDNTGADYYGYLPIQIGVEATAAGGTTGAVSSTTTTSAGGTTSTSAGAATSTGAGGTSAAMPDADPAMEDPRTARKPSSGCSVPGAPAQGGSFGVLLLGSCWLVVRRRRRRRREANHAVHGRWHVGSSSPQELDAGPPQS